MLTCPTCGAENRAGAKFCHACGAPLENDPQQICNEVVRRALEAGATDNVSVVVVGAAET